MKLLFLTLAPLSSNGGHLARLSQELEYLSEDNEITIVCLGKTPEDLQIKKKYKSVNFEHYPVTFNGWDVKDIDKLARYLNTIVEEKKVDLVILQMEIWDLMRELGKSFKNKVTFATVLHAMPFVVAPLNPTKDFENDVIDYANSEVENYRKNYILRHYKEANSVFKNINVIANNETVAFYFKNYFSEIPIWVQPKSIVIKNKKNKIVNTKYKYDFIYMARIERGKGLEYLSTILKKISNILSRKINIAILGRTDDKFSKEKLDSLISESKDSEYFKVDYLGWVDNKQKQEILPKSSIFLYPSHYDNYPTVVNEALVLGLPVITWDVLFSQINYSTTSAVKRAKFLDFNEFAEMAVEALNNKSELSDSTIKFIENFKDIKEVAMLEDQLFKNIVNQPDEK